MHGGGHRWGLAPGSLQLWAGLVLLIGTENDHCLEAALSWAGTRRSCSSQVGKGPGLQPV